VDFFEQKFPELAKNDFYITGESYAGVYIPTLSKQILDHTSLPLKGIAVGDPCTDNKAQDDSMNSLWYANKYGLMDEEVFDLLWNKCNIRLPNLMTQGGISHVIATLNEELRWIEDVEARHQTAQSLYHKIILNGAFDQAKVSAECTIALRKFMMSSSHGLSQSWKDLYIDDYSLFAPVTSLEDEQMTTYMSRADVRKALHVAEAPTTTWPGASVGFDYTKEYMACNWGTPLLDISMIDIYREIVPKLERTWIYNGDTDPCVSYEGTRLAVKQIQLDELDGGSYRPWFYNQTAAPLEILATKSALFGPNLVAQNMGAQFGGEVVDYKEGLAFVTFHGSGHMVPQFRPQAALHFLNQFLSNGKLLSPLLPSNATLTELSDADFLTAMNGWTEAAMKAPYVTPDLVAEAATTSRGTSTTSKNSQQAEQKKNEQKVELALHLH
jgi:serine carboxypeptidase-like clade 1